MTTPTPAPVPRQPRPRLVPALRTGTVFQNAPHISGGTDKRYIAPGTTTDVLVKTGPGRLCRVVVTQSGTAAVMIIDHETSNVGDPLGVVPPHAPIGSVFDFQTPALQGIRVAGDENLPGVIITYY